MAFDLETSRRDPLRKIVQLDLVLHPHLRHGKATGEGEEENHAR
jgi:hypothetical protein